MDRVVETILSYDVVNTYPEKTESTTQKIQHSVPKVIIEVNLPASRRCTSARAFLSFHGEVAENLKDPEVLNGDKKIVLNVKNAKAGEEYVVQWEW